MLTISTSPLLEKNNFNLLLSLTITDLPMKSLVLHAHKKSAKRVKCLVYKIIGFSWGILC